MDLKAGPVLMTTLEYLPLHPVGTPEFDQTAGGWLRCGRAGWYNRDRLR
jgi:hypothetical protein